MTHFKFIFILLAAVISLAGSILILHHVYKRRASRQEAEAASLHAAPVPSKTKTKSSACDKLKAAVFSIGIILILMIVRILRLPIIEILLGGLFLLFPFFSLGTCLFGVKQENWAVQFRLAIYLLQFLQFLSRLGFSLAAWAEC